MSGRVVRRVAALPPAQRARAYGRRVHRAHPIWADVADCDDALWQMFDHLREDLGLFHRGTYQDFLEAIVAFSVSPSRPLDAARAQPPPPLL
jgi:hypothetical protein